MLLNRSHLIVESMLYLFRAIDEWVWVHEKVKIDDTVWLDYSMYIIIIYFECEVWSIEIS